MGDYDVFLAGSHKCLDVIRALVSPLKSVSLFLFDGTIAENIAFSRPSATQ
jgi:ABC-type multidrug transport system fused ATPase/permease subunit